jgi:hypothetical protein
MDQGEVEMTTEETAPQEATPQKIARDTLAAIRQEPDALYMGTWISAPDGRNLRPGDSPSACGTTLCLAGWACHVGGYWLDPDSYAHRPGERPQQINSVARRLLGLGTRTPFYVTEPEAIRFLELVADGTEPDTAVIEAHGTGDAS